MSQISKADRVAAKVRQVKDKPDEAFVNIDVVAAIYDRSPASIWRDVKAGRVPKPVAVTPRCTRWRIGDIRKALGE